MVKSFEAYNGMSEVVVGKRKNGKPYVVLLINLLVCTSEADARRIAKAHPSLKFMARDK